MKTLTIIVLALLQAKVYSQTEDFSTFANQFYSDSTFQIDRIKFPIVTITYNMNMDRFDTSIIAKKDWVYSDNNYHQNSFKTQVYDNYSMTLRNTGERVIHFVGIENGLNYSMYFKLVGKKWFLIKTVDHST